MASHNTATSTGTLHRASALLAIALLVAMLAVALTLVPSIAHGQTPSVPPAVASDLATTPTDSASYPWLEKGGLPKARATVTAAGSAAQVADELWSAEHRPIPGQPSSAEMYRSLREETYKARRRARLLPSLKLLRPNPITLLAGANVVVWSKVVSDFKSLFFGTTAPQRLGSVTAVYYREKGENQTNNYYFGTYVNMPADGWDAFGSMDRDCGTGYYDYYGACDPLPSQWEQAGFRTVRASWARGGSSPDSYTLMAGWMPAQLSAAEDVLPAGQTSSGTVTWPGAGQGTNGEPPETTKQRIADELAAHPEEYPTLLPWLDFHLGGPSEDPTGEYVRLPACRAETYAVCEQRLQANGLTSRRVELDFDTADLEVPAEGVVRTDPATGQRARVGDEVSVYVNPTAANMPVVVPGIQPGETYEEYAERLRELELAPVREDATEITLNYGPDGAMSTRPGTGTRTRKDTEVVVVTRPRRQRCDLSDPTDEYMVGTSQQSMDPFTGDPPRYPSSANPVFFTPRNLLKPSTVLRWGTTSPQAPPDLWDGFGYRHIAAKHGWSPADEAATRDVLTSAQPTPDPLGRGYNRWQFVGTPYPGRDGRPCVRVVIVDYGIAPGNTQPEGIITSFGRDPF